MGRATRVRRRLTARLGGLFAPRVVAVVLLAGGVATLLGGFVPVVGGLGGLVGVGVAAFWYGLAGRRVYAEVATAGALAAGLAALLDYLVLALAAGLGTPIVVVGGAAGAGAGVLGHYLGRDLRDGLTREV